MLQVQQHNIVIFYEIAIELYTLTVVVSIYTMILVGKRNKFVRIDVEKDRRINLYYDQWND